MKLAAPLLLWLAGCAAPALSLAPGPPPPPACPLEGCDPARAAQLAAAHPPDPCPGAGEAPCAGTSGRECAQRALAAWADAQDEQQVACIARTLSDACKLGDAPACAHAGRMWIDGRGVARDPRRGIDMLLTACEAGEWLACMAGTRWLSDERRASSVPDGSELRGRMDKEASCLTGAADECFDIALNFWRGNSMYPRDRGRSAVEYRRGCDLGSAVSCSNLGDAYEYGEAVPRDLTRAAALYERACHMGFTLGCANLGHLVQNGEGVPRDLTRARSLYRDACNGGEVYGCLHLQLMAAEDAGAPRDPRRSVEHWERSCRARDARACAFVGLLFEDGPDGYARDEVRSLQAMSRACELRLPSACQWLQEHPAP